MPIGLGAILAGTAASGILSGGTLGDILSGIFGVGSKQPTTQSPFVSGGVQVGSGIDPKLIFYGVLAVMLTIIIGIFATRPTRRRRR